MIRSRLLLAAGFVAAIVVARWLLAERSGDGSEALPEARAEYRLEDFELTIMNAQGLPRFVVSAPLLERNPEDGSALVDDPDMLLFEAGQPSWTVVADSGWVANDGATVRLDGAVRMVSQETEPTRVTTESLTLFPDTDAASSDEHVLIDGPRGRLEGVGMRAQLDSRAWELLSEVRARLLPSRS